MHDAQAITRLRAGDISGLEALVQRYQTKAVRAAVLITRDAGLAEEVVQAAFIRFYERVHLFDAARPFEPYFMRMVANDALKKVTRGDAKAMPLEDIELTDPMPTPEIIAERGEQEAAVRAMLDRLTPEERTAVVMRYYLGLSEADMSDQLNVPQGTIKWRLHSARKRLRGLLGELSHG